ncbi:MAG: tRNA (adenosine(37)-N6)-threonylcarbamoyltransferase complex transferase subunit TsaD [Pyrinomonadaceae bacterium]
MLVLGIESSCDETAASVVKDGRTILSSVIFSQTELHTNFGGVVPELASREHLQQIDPVVKEAVCKAGVDLSEIDAIAVTQGPGLVGSLLVGVCYAKALAFGLDIPIFGVNHIEGHVYSVAFENPEIEYPALALIVSGGHTNLFYIPEEGSYEVVSRTRDDAAGEAFDKVAKMLGLGYPGGPLIEKTAIEGNEKRFKFTTAKISDGKPDFSFSGLKTAVSRFIREESIVPVPPGEEPGEKVIDLAASFQFAVVNALISTLKKQAGERNPKTLIVAGGVACNLALRTAAEKMASALALPVYFPSKALSTDNAAMIAAAGHFHLSRGERADLTMGADISMRLQNIGVPDSQLRKRKVRYRL